MNHLESLRVAWRALRVNKMRSMLTVLGIIVGVAAVVCMVSVGAGAQAQVSEKIRTLGANLLLVTPGAQSTGGVRMEPGTRLLRKMRSPFDATFRPCRSQLLFFRVGLRLSRAIRIGPRWWLASIP